MCSVSKRLAYRLPSALLDSKRSSKHSNGTVCSVPLNNMAFSMETVRSWNLNKCCPGHDFLFYSILLEQLPQTNLLCSQQLQSIRRRERMINKRGVRRRSPLSSLSTDLPLWILGKERKGVLHVCRSWRIRMKTRSNDKSVTCTLQNTNRVPTLWVGRDCALLYEKVLQEDSLDVCAACGSRCVRV